MNRQEKRMLLLLVILTITVYFFAVFAWYYGFEILFVVSFTVGFWLIVRTILEIGFYIKAKRT